MHIIKFRILTSVLLVLCRAVLGQSPEEVWPFYGCDAGSERYAALGQINDSNVGGLKVAWIYPGTG